MMRRTWPLLVALLIAPCSAQAPADLDRLVAAGRLDDAELLARSAGDSARIWVADILVLRGRLAAAESLYTVLRRDGGSGARRALAGLAELAMRRGDRDRSKVLAAELATSWNQRQGSWSVHEHVAAGRAFRLLGEGDPAQVRNALAAFDAATAADTASVEGRLRAADLFLERYNAPDAQVGYNEVLARRPDDPRALVGLAHVASLGSGTDPVPLLRRALAANPRSLPALLLQARLLLEAEHLDSAAIVVQQALAVDSSSSEAWAALGVLAWLTGDAVTSRRAEAAAAALNPRPAAFFATLADAAGRQRRYADAVTLAERAVALDSLSVAALGALGTNLLRVGRIADGKVHLERAFARDPYHLWHKNTLDLIDHLETFRVTTAGRFQIVAPERNADLMVAMLVPLLEEAYDSLAARYQYQPPTPIRLELYDRHADFSVRTVGLVGLGALGVSFGTVLVMDAPEARGVGEWNLGSTAWHELAHTFTLGLSNNRVPRWVSEGLSVLEERRASSGWGARANIPFAQALALGQLLPVARLNDGFVRPDRPDRLGLSYYQASLVMEYLEQQHGIAGIRQLLQGYASGRTSAEVLEQVSGVTIDSLDARIQAWLRDRFADPIRAITAGDPGAITRPMNAAVAAIAANDSAAAITALRQARAQFPELGDASGPGMPLAMGLWRRGDRRGALVELAVVTGGDETALDANLLESEWRLEVGDTSGAVAAIARASWIAPNDASVWRRWAEIAAAAGRPPDEIRARRALIALRPSDLHAARTDLAEALLRGGDAASARRELLGVLERAPGYERAQDLLLQARRP